eukprot:TRINITY_DN39272_c0_g1_i1.p1 TRINITY_DN39272_c0_g1~~TRINITY_DN39272_c0_g1_i1.p1  ORF type:complete len:1273 (+),score=234.32 TRINITY_DN39272_c0_g1_i1:51-3869(+)
MIKADGASCNGTSPVPNAASYDSVAAALAATSEPLLRAPAADAYTEEQKRGCLALALRLREPRLGDVLEQLHRLAATPARRSSAAGGAPSATWDAALKALAVLLGVRASANVAIEAIAARLVTAAKGWLRGHRLRALALLLQAPGVEADDLLKLALRASPHGLLVAALCVIFETPLPEQHDGQASCSLDAQQQAIALRLVRGRLPVDLHPCDGLKILAAALRCDATESKVLTHIASAGWGTNARDAAKRIVQGKVAVDDKPEHLSVTAITALRREPRDRQLRSIAGFLSGTARGAAVAREGRPTEAVIVETLACCAAELPGDAVEAILNVVLAAGEAAASTDGVVPERVVEVIVHRIGASSRTLSTPELRLQALASLFQTAARQEALLARVARARICGSLPPRICRAVVECLLLGKPLTAQARSRSNEQASASPTLPLLGALQRLTTASAEKMSPEAIRAVIDAYLLAEGNDTQNSAVGEQAPLASARPKAPPAPTLASASPSAAQFERGACSGMRQVGSAAITTTKAPNGGLSVAPGSGRFGLGALELEPLDDEDDDEDSESIGDNGWMALRALVDEEGEERSESSDVEDDEEGGGEDEDEDEEASSPAKEPQSSPSATLLDATVEKPPAAATKAKHSKDDVIEEDDNNEDSEGDEEFCNEEEEDEEGEKDSYHGSDLDVDIADAEDSEEVASEERSEDEDGVDLSQGGLLTSCFSGGSLHAEEKRTSRDALGRAPAQKTKPSIRVVFPTLIWRGKDMMVLNKPADWICSASDVDKKKGRALDPNEKVANKGFAVLDDLLQYKFGDREKKYIHWWIQLMHDLDEESYPNLFDEDQNYGLCHRLDRETSGTVLVGLTQLARQQMRECFHRHYVRKLYVCLVHGTVEPHEQTIDRHLEAMGQKARLHPNGKRARTHVTVLGYYSRKKKDGTSEEFSLCTCEIAEGRMHQIRLHMSGAIGAPIVSEFYYQKPKQMIEDRRWCQRTFLHAYAVGFPDVSGSRRVGVDSSIGTGECGMVEEERIDTEQEWHCCICPLTVELREALKDMVPRDEEAGKLLSTIQETGLLSATHQAVHCMGTTSRKGEIDDSFFPWSSIVNPIEVGDLNKPREANSRPGDGKGKGRGKGDAATRPQTKPRRRLEGPRRTGSPRWRDGPHMRKRVRPGERGRQRSPMRSRSLGGSPPGGPSGPPRQGRRLRSRSGRPVRRVASPGGTRRRQPGAPQSPRRSVSREGLRRKRRRNPSHSGSPTSRGPPLSRGSAGGGGANGGVSGSAAGI